MGQTHREHHHLHHHCGVSWIWGPPGTGKTTTVAAIVRALITDGLRVLVVSNTNTALDTALARFLAVQGGQSRPGGVVRIGSPVHEQLSQYRPWPVLLDEEAARAGSRVAEAKVAVEQAIVELRRTRAGIRKQKNKQKQWLDTALSRLSEAQELVHRLERQLRDASVDRAATAVRRAEERLAHARVASLSRSELAIRQRDVAAAVRRARLAPDVCRGLQAEHAQAVDAAAALETDVEQGRRRLPQSERELAAVDADLAEYQAEVRRLDRLLTYVRRRVLDDADAVFATVHRCYLADLAGCRFDVVVIDEASMVAVPLALFAAGLGRGHTIVAGDFRQLGPITATDAASSAAEWMGRSVFEMAGIDQAVSAGSCVPTLTTLRQQHRMRPGVADLVGSGFYPEAGLVTSPRVLDRMVPAALARCLPDGDIFLVDTTSARPWMARAGGLGSRYNPIHALVVDALIRWIEGTGTDVGTGIGVIAPFSPQARLLHGLLADHESAAETGTVHRYQGGERDVIIYDTTEAPAHGIGVHPWFTGSDAEDAGARLLNVALSRARDRLIVIADLNRLAPAASAGTPAARTLATLFRQATRLQWRDILESGATGITRFTGSAATPGLVQAITGATHRVVVWTSATGHPTSTGRRVEEALAGAAHRGVDVTLWLPSTALPRVWPVLADTAVAVHPLEQVRESVAVVDDQIFVSSGDLLAGRPGDLTLVHRGPQASQALLNLLRRRRTKQAFGDDERTRPCPRCGIPLIRIERWDKRVWMRCDRCRAAPAASPGSEAGSDGLPQHPPPAIARLPRPRTAPTLCPSCGQLPTATARCSCS
jgi:hypothetical protein